MFGEEIQGFIDIADRVVGIVEGRIVGVDDDAGDILADLIDDIGDVAVVPVKSGTVDIGFITEFLDADVIGTLVLKQLQQSIFQHLSAQPTSEVFFHDLSPTHRSVNVA